MLCLPAIFLFKAFKAFYNLKCPSVSLFVCLFVCLLVRVFTFEVPFKSWMSKFFRDSEFLGKSNGKKWSLI